MMHSKNISHHCKLLDLLESTGGELELKTIEYDGNHLKMQLVDFDDNDLSLTIRTSTVRSRLSKKSCPDLCRIVVTNVNDVLQVDENLYYRPSNCFIDLMKEVRIGMSFFYGLKKSDYYYFSLVSAQELVGCCVHTLDDINLVIN